MIIPSVEELLAVEKEDTPVSSTDWKPLRSGPHFYGEWACEFGCPKLQWICEPLGGFREPPEAGPLREEFIHGERLAFARAVRLEIAKHAREVHGA
jgi:hypothetical protein